MKRRSRHTVKRPPDPDLAPYMRRNGYTMVPHKILERIISNDFGLTKNEMQVLLTLIRKTWGFQHWSDRISLSQIRKRTQIDTRVISRSLKSLERRGILVRVSKHSWRNLKATGWAVEPDTSKWLGPDRSGRSTPRGNHAHSLRANRTPNQGANSPTTRDTLKDKDKYSRPEKSKSNLEKFENDGVRYSIRKAI